MKASGLTSPIPGLAELKGQGTFFDCAPYGTCWEPKSSQRPRMTGSNQPTRFRKPGRPPPRLWHQARMLCGPTFTRATRFGGVQAQMGLPDPFGMTDVNYFPCFPAALRYRVCQRSDNRRLRRSEIPE